MSRTRCKDDVDLLVDELELHVLEDVEARTRAGPGCARCAGRVVPRRCSMLMTAVVVVVESSLTLLRERSVLDVGQYAVTGMEDQPVSPHDTILTIRAAAIVACQWWRLRLVSFQPGCCSLQRIS